MKPASIFKRIAAFLVDQVILMILLVIVGSLLKAIMPPSNTILDSAKELVDKTV